MLTRLKWSGGKPDAAKRTKRAPVQFLSREQECQLASQIRQGGPLGELARTRFIEANLRLVSRIALRYQVARGAMDYDDLIQEGRIGLMRAVERFDPAYGCTFATYAIWWIHQAILRGLDEKSSAIHIPTNRMMALRRMQRTEQWLFQQNHQLPKGAELARATGLTVVEMETLHGIARLLDVCSLEQILASPGEEECPGSSFSEEVLTRGKVLFRSEDDTEELGLTSAFHAMIRSVLAQTLPPRERLALELRFGFSGHEQTLEETGQHLGVTSGRVRQIQERALRRLRHAPVRATLSA